MKKTILGFMVAVGVSNPTFAMTQLNDDQLSAVQGQALFNLSFQLGDAGTDVSGVQYDSSGIGFYKLGLEAVMNMNANIKKLQLGCGGVNGVGGCDIDIDHLGLSGIPGTGEVRADTSAEITNPFVEFAIKNPGSAATREILGYRVSAEKIKGLLTAGTDNNTPNGINSLSGYMKVNGYGTATTQQALFNSQIKGLADINILGGLCTSGCGNNKGYTSYVDGKNKGLNIPSMSAGFNVTNSVVSGNRMTSAKVTAVANIPDIVLTPDSGSLGVKLDQDVCILWGVCIGETSIKMNLTLKNLKARINFDEGLGYIHNIPLNSSGYLALQSQDLKWPNAEEIAKRGWWMSFQDPVDLGNISPKDAVSIADVLPQVADHLSFYLKQPQWKVSVDSWDGIKTLFGAGLEKNIPDIDLTNNSTTIYLSDLILANQAVQPNCYGGLKFC